MAHENARTGARFLYHRGSLCVCGAEPSCWTFIHVRSQTIDNITIKPGHEQNHPLCRFGRPQEFLGKSCFPLYVSASSRLCVKMTSAFNGGYIQPRNAKHAGGPLKISRSHRAP